MSALPSLRRAAWALLWLTLGTASALAQRTAGQALAANANRGGAVLVFNLYTSDAAKPETQNTLFNLTNTSTSQAAAVRLFAVRSGDGAVADAFICLTPNQTASFAATDLDPGTTGYLLAIAVDKDSGCPLGFNYLLGSAYVKLASGHTAALAAESFPAYFNGLLPTWRADDLLATLAFDGSQYALAPQTIALEHIPSPGEGNRTLVVLNSFGGTLSVIGNGVPKLGEFGGRLFDDAENSYSFSAVGNQQFRAVLANDFPNVLLRINQLITPGRTGWMTLGVAERQALTGAAINFHPEAMTKRTQYNSGRNLAHLRLTPVNLILPVFPSRC